MIKKRLDTKAWIRIVEAFLAILIIMGTVLVVLQRQAPQADITDIIYEKQSQILKLISNNNTLRQEIITTADTEDNEMINNAIVNMLPANLDFTTEICLLDDICNSDNTPNDKQVYVTERVVTSTLTDYSPKKLRFFVWMK